MTQEKAAVLMLAAIIQMSDHAQECGGAGTISGVAALHKMQTSIQKNRARAVAMLADLADSEDTANPSPTIHPQRPARANNPRRGGQ